VHCRGTVNFKKLLSRKTFKSSEIMIIQWDLLEEKFTAFIGHKTRVVKNKKDYKG